MSFWGLDLSIPASWSRNAEKRMVSSGSYSRHFPYGSSLSTWAGVVVARGELPVDQGAPGALGLGGAEVGRLEDRADRALGRDRGLRHGLATPDDETAEVLGPGSVGGAVDDDIADLACAQLLGPRRESDVGVDLALGEKLECALMILSSRRPRPSHEPDVPRYRAGKHLVDPGRVQAENDLEQAAEERAIFVQHRPVAVLVQRSALDCYLFTRNMPAAHRAAQYPIHGAMAVVGASRAVFPEGTAEFRDHDDDSLAPCRPHLLRERCQPLAEVAEQIGQLALRAAFVDVGVPAADIDEREVELVAHQPGHALRLEVEPPRAHRVTVGGLHLTAGAAGRHHLGLLGDHLAQLEAFADQMLEAGPRIHARQQGYLPVVERLTRRALEREVRDHDVARHYDRQPLGERDGRRGSAERGGQAVHEA